MAKYVDFMLEGETIEPGQNIQMFCVQDGTGALHYVRDCPILWRISDHSDTVDDDEKKWGLADVSFDTDDMPLGTGWTTLRFQTQMGEKLWKSEIRRTSLSLYEVTVTNAKSGTVQAAQRDPRGRGVGRVITLWRRETPPAPPEKKGNGAATPPKSGGTKAPKDEAKPVKAASTGAELKWSVSEKRKAYWSMLETAYPHLKGVPQRAQTGSAAIRSEASTLLAMLELAEEFKHAKNKNNRSQAVTTALSKAPGSSDAKKLAFILPDADGDTRGGIAHPNQQVTYYDWLWKEKLEKSASAIFNGFMGGENDDPQVRVVAVGDGGGTNGVLKKTNESIGLAPYAGAQSAQSIILKQASGGRRTIVHVFITGLNFASEKAPATFSIKGGGTTYKFEAMMCGAQASIRPHGMRNPTRTLSSGLKIYKTTYGDGAQWDSEKGDFTFPPNVFGSDPSVRVDVDAAYKDGEYDEMLFGVCIVGEPPPVAMFGLFKKGKQEQVPLAPADLPESDAKTQLEQAYEELDEVARTALQMKTFEVVLAGGGCGKKSGARVVSATELEADGLKSLPESEMQKLRASFLDTAINYTTLHMKLTISSFTDPDWTYADNKGLSARRSWGLLGLLCKRMKTLEAGTPLAKELWNAAKTDTTPPGKADYLKTPGAIVPSRL